MGLYYSCCYTVLCMGDDSQPRSPRGRFSSQYKERRGETIALRLPESLDQQLREAAGWKSKDDNRALKDWVEQAIAEKLGRG